MQLTESEEIDSSSAEPSMGFRIEVVDALFEGKKIFGPVAQARALGLGKSHWIRLRSGEVQPLVNLVLRIAAFLGTSVEAIYGRVA